MHGLGGEDFASAFGYTHLALAAAAFAAAGRGEKHVFGGESRQERAAGFYFNLAVVVDGDGYFSGAYQIVLGHEQYNHQQECDDQEDADARQ